MCLEQDHIEALESFNYDLALDIMYQLHGICDVETYLRRMRLPTSNGPIENAYFTEFPCKYVGVRMSS